MNNLRFSDVPASHWAAKYIYFLENRGIVSGIGNNSFTPERLVTIGEFCTMAVKAANITTNDRFAYVKNRGIRLHSTDGFTENTHIQRQYAFNVAWNIIHGISLGRLRRFTPTDGQPYQILQNKFEEFSDSRGVDSSVREAAFQLYANGAVSGFPDGTLKPTNVLTRAEASTILSLCVDRRNEIDAFWEGNEEIVSKAQLERLFNRTSHFQKNSITNTIVDDLNRALRKYEINTYERITMFMATVAHESKTGLVEVGVGNIYVVDGVDYRGGGYTQLTGHLNYKAFAEQMAREGLVTLSPVGNNPITYQGGGAEYVAKHFPWESAGWHWNAPGNTLNRRIAEGANFYKVSQVINGGPNYSGTPNGWAEREAFYEMAKEVFK
jgi:predicted chitinase